MAGNQCTQLSSHFEAVIFYFTIIYKKYLCTANLLKLKEFSFQISKFGPGNIVVEVTLGNSVVNVSASWEWPAQKSGKAIEVLIQKQNI